MIKQGDALSKLKELESESVHTCITSPPYWGLRDYGTDGQLGLEPTFHEYIANLVEIFREVKRVLKKDGTLWLNLGDSYNGTGEKRVQHSSSKIQKNNRGARVQATKLDTSLKPKDLVGIPWRVALALQADDWYLRQDIIWHKPNPMPESVTDRCTKAHEYIFLLSKSQKYYFDHEDIKEPAAYDGPNGQGFTRRARGGGKKYSDKNGDINKTFGNSQNLDKAGEKIWETKNKRSVWTVATKPFSDAHFATFPTALIDPCVKASTKPGDTVLDPFLGAGTTALVAVDNKRKYIGIEINPEYIKIATDRLGLYEIIL